MFELDYNNVCRVEIKVAIFWECADGLSGWTGESFRNFLKTIYFIKFRLHFSQFGVKIYLLFDYFKFNLFAQFPNHSDNWPLH